MQQTLLSSITQPRLRDLYEGKGLNVSAQLHHLTERFLSETYQDEYFSDGVIGSDKQAQLRDSLGTISMYVQLLQEETPRCYEQLRKVNNLSHEISGPNARQISPTYVREVQTALTELLPLL